MANTTNFLNNNPATQINPSSGSSKKFQKWMIAPVAGGVALVLGGAGFGAYAYTHRDNEKSTVDPNTEEDPEAVNAEIIETNTDEDQDLIDQDEPIDPEIEGDGYADGEDGFTDDPVGIYDDDPVESLAMDEEPVATSSYIGTRIETPAELDSVPTPAAAEPGATVINNSEVTINNYYINNNQSGTMANISSHEGYTNVSYDSTQIHQAHSVNDNMSFAQAFAAAREEVGPGGVFVWHGGVYGTYYVNEWNAMSPEEQLAFSNSFHYQGQPHHHDHHNNFANNHLEEPADPIVTDPNQVALEPEEEEGGLMLIGQEYNAENDMHLAYVTDGENVAMFADVDNDGTYDYYVADFDGNGQITDNEIVDISGQGLSINDVASLPQYDNPDPYDVAMS